MVLRRLALVALSVLALAPGGARAAFPVGVYPFRVPGLAPDQRHDLHALLDAALVSAARRGIIQPRAPALQPATCGEAMAPACLGAAAKDGLLLVARGELKGGLILVGAVLYDRNGAHTREVRFVVDLVIQNTRPVAEAIAQLELEVEPDGTVSGSRPPAAAGPAPAAAAPRPVAPPPPGAAGPRSPAVATPSAVPPRGPAVAPSAAAAPGPRAPAGAAPAPAPTAAAPLAARPAPAPASGAKAAPVDVSAPAPAVWKRQAGPLFTVLGGALLAGGATVAVLNGRLAHDLDAKRAAGTLGASDRASYDRVDRYNVLSAVLLSAGGVSAAAGTYLWITAPARPGGGAVAVAGGSF